MDRGKKHKCILGHCIVADSWLGLKARDEKNRQFTQWLTHYHYVVVTYHSTPLCWSFPNMLVLTHQSTCYQGSGQHQSSYLVHIWVYLGGIALNKQWMHNLACYASLKGFSWLHLSDHLPSATTTGLSEHCVIFVVGDFNPIFHDSVIWHLPLHGTECWVEQTTP